MTYRRSFRYVLTLALLALPCALYGADVSITAANVLPGANAVIQSNTAGASITAGQLVYLDASTNTVKLADTNNTILTAACYGVALNGASSGQPINIQTAGDYTLGGTITVGGIYIVSATAGAVAPVADLASGYYTTVWAIGKTTTVATIINRGPSTLVPVP